MSSCEEHGATLSALIDGELDRSALLPTLDHLVRCPSCRELFAAARHLEGSLALIRAPGHGSPPASGTWRRIRGAAGLKGRGPRTRLASQGLAAAAVAVLVVGLWAARSFAPTLPEARPGSDHRIHLSRDPKSMSEERFVALTAELLRAEGRYHRKMLEILEHVDGESFIAEGSNDEDRPWPEDGEESDRADGRDPLGMLGRQWW